MENYQAKSIMHVQKHISTPIRDYIYLLAEAHERSGLSLREVAQFSDLDPTYVHYILNGARRPPRDVIIALGFTYRLERTEVDEILLSLVFHPWGVVHLKNIATR